MTGMPPLQGGTIKLRASLDVYSLNALKRGATLFDPPSLRDAAADHVRGRRVRLIRGATLKSYMLRGINEAQGRDRRETKWKTRADAETAKRKMMKRSPRRLRCTRELFVV